MKNLKSLFKKFTFSLIVCSQLLLCAQADDIPAGGGTEVSVGLTQRQEQVLGDQLMRDMRRHAPLLQDPIINDYAYHLGDRLKAGIDKKDVRYNFFVLEANSINAFALPGGYIGIHTGLLTTTQNESELAAVLSHEMAHVSQRHIAQLFERSKRYSWPTIAAAVGSILLATQNPDMGQGALAATLATNQQAMINFTRENESEADRIGIETMAKAGFDPRSMSRFFERMADRNRYMPHMPEFLSTHPVTERRVADARSRAERYPIVKREDNPNFYLIQQRIAIDEENNPQQSVMRLKTELDKKENPHSEATRYGYAIALTKAFQLEDAQKQLEILIAQNPQQYIYQLAMVDIENITKNYKSALARLQKMQSLYPNTTAIPLQLANTALGAGDGKLARNTLQQYLRTHKEDNNAYELLTEANAVLGDSIGAHQAQAENYALEGDFGGAIDQLESAEKLAVKDKYLTARLGARKAEFEKALAQEKKDKI